MDTTPNSKGKYVIITELEFDALLKPDKGWTKSYSYEELVYTYQTKKNKDVVIKVYSSINKTGLSRKCGGDAIRIVGVNTKTNKGILKATRTYRVPDWEEKVQKKVLELIEKIF